VYIYYFLRILFVRGNVLYDIKMSLNRYR